MSAFPPECADPRKGISVVTSWQAHRGVVKASSEVCRVRYASHPFPLHHSIEKHLRPVMWNVGASLAVRIEAQVLCRLCGRKPGSSTRLFSAAAAAGLRGEQGVFSLCSRPAGSCCRASNARRGGGTLSMADGMLTPSTRVTSRNHQ